MMVARISSQSSIVLSAASGFSLARCMPWLTAACRVWTTSRRKVSSGSVIGVGSMTALIFSTTSGLSEILPTLQRVGHLQPHPFDDRVSLGHVLLPGFGVGPLLQPPVHVALGALRLGAAEHVERGDVPEVDRALHPVFLLAALCRHLGRAGRPVVDVPIFLQHDPRGVLEDAREWGVGAADELLELVLAHAVDQEAEDGEVFPGVDLPAERLEEALPV